MGGFIAKENPPASLDNYEDCVRALILRTGMKLASVAACHPGYVDEGTPIMYDKHFLWSTTIPGFEKLGTLCPLGLKITTPTLEASGAAQEHSSPSKQHAAPGNVLRNALDSRLHLYPG